MEQVRFNKDSNKNDSEIKIGTTGNRKERASNNSQLCSLQQQLVHKTALAWSPKGKPIHIKFNINSSL